jgi:hypothetical protein
MSRMCIIIVLSLDVGANSIHRGNYLDISGLIS